MSEIDEATNVNLNLPAELLERARYLASHLGESLDSVVQQALEKLLEEHETQCKAAAHRFLERIRNPPERRTSGAISWTRDELYEC